jgi:signal transduction histidine kinase
MEGTRGVRRTAPALALVLAALVVGIDVVGVAVFSTQAPYVGFLELARAALPALAFAGAAIVVTLLGRGGLGPPTLGLAGVAAAAPWLGAGLQQTSPAWVGVESLGVGLAPAVVVVALVHPDGRLVGRVRRVAVWLAIALGALGVAVRAAAYDPATWDWCRCVDNPVAVLDWSGPSYLRLADALAVAQAGIVLVGLGVLLTTWRRPGGPAAWAFLACYAALASSLLAVAVTRFSATVESGPAEAVRDVSLVLVPVLYAVSFAAQRPSRAHVADLLVAAREEHQPSRLRELVARAIGDPRAVVAWWDPAAATFRDHLGRPVDVPDRDVLPVEAGGRPIAVVLSDRLDTLDPSVRESVAEALLLSAENRRLTAELQASLEQVRDSRARILSASDDTRRRIERDLHDGAQQLLISTGIKLNLAAARVGGDDAELAQVLEEATAELNRALAELRNLAGGIAPTALVHGSLGNALQELALRSAVPTTVRVTGDGEPDEHLSATVYFVVAEFLTNVAKHADATTAAVEVGLGDPLLVSVSDDGHGGASIGGGGTGLRGLVDRVEARGGRLEVTSGAEGTVAAATIPVGVAEVVESLER